MMNARDQLIAATINSGIFDEFSHRDAETLLDDILDTFLLLGLKVVPVEATKEMVECVAKHYFISDSQISGIYDLLLAAAPDVLEGKIHTSCCAVHNGPALPIGPCDCEGA